MSTLCVCVHFLCIFIWKSICCSIWFFTSLFIIPGTGLRKWWILSDCRWIWCDDMAGLYVCCSSLPRLSRLSGICQRWSCLSGNTHTICVLFPFLIFFCTLSFFPYGVLFHLFSFLFFPFIFLFIFFSFSFYSLLSFCSLFSFYHSLLLLFQHVFFYSVLSFVSWNFF